MSEQANMPARLREGIDAAKRGDKITARRLLLQVLSSDSDNEIAMMWMASVVDTLNERRYYLERALQVNPNNARAREALHRLGVETSGAAPAASRGESRGSAINATSNIYLLAAAVVAFVVIAVVVAALVTSLSANNLPTPTQNVQATSAAQINPTAEPTNGQLPPTETVLPGIVVTIDTSAFTPLPPTFTPTFTPVPTETPPPTATPLPLDSFTAIYADIEAGEAVPSLYRGSADGTGEVKLAAAGEGGFRDVAVDPTGEQIAFVRDVEYEDGAVEQQIFIASIEALDEARYITNLSATTMTRPAWSPDGSQIVFTSDDDGDDEIWIINADGGNPQKLTDNEVRDADPSFSADGELIVFASEMNSPGFSEIFTMTTDGADITQLTDDAQSSYSPAWSPDGTRIAFISNRGGDGDVYVMDANGQRPFLLTQDDDGAEDRTPAWTPDSNWVIFASNRELDRFHWYAINLQGDVEQVTRVDRNPQSLSFSTR